MENNEIKDQQVTQSTETADERFEQQVNEWKDKYLHLNADFQNYRRRIDKEKTQWMYTAQADVLIKLLSIVDDFDRALKEHIKEGHTEQLDSWLVGFELIGKSLHKFLADQGVTHITELDVFDPYLHEAVAQVVSDKHASGQIVDVFQKGYRFKGDVLRPAKVTVAQ